MKILFRRPLPLREPSHTAFPQHGKPKTYKAGCRCALCRESQRVAIAEYRAARKEHRDLALLMAAAVVEKQAQEIARNSPDVFNARVEKELRLIAKGLRRRGGAVQ